MVLSGPQKYPPASTAYWYQRGYPGSAMETNVVVWHSTEGTSLPSYSGGAVAPNFTALPDFGAEKIRWYQHYDFDVSSRALRNLGGGVETNTANVCQVEVVGTCDPSAHRRWGGQHLYMPELPDWAVRDLAAFAKWAHEKHGVPLKSGLTFKPYPASYGSNGVRLSGSQWRSFYGHCGHQHVPENDHGDPGAFPMAPILARAAGVPEEDEVTKDDIEKIADAVFKKLTTTDNVFEAPEDAESYKTNRFWTWKSHVATQTRAARGARRAAESAVAKLDQVLAKLNEKG
ncbi:hypothetical protein [Streptomyces sp. 184]|uniref:hypothetical protein n=1 Tax=Streptomyces sp. 184 TaxID=1827526 RepID=UPI0038921818